MQEPHLNPADHAWLQLPADGPRLRKDERANILGGPSLSHDQKSHEPDICDELTVGQAFAATVEECVRQFRANQGLIIAECDPAALHQARVAMRRLRTAFALFRPAIRLESLRPLKAELRAFLAPFGEARNLDVYLGHHAGEIGRQDLQKLTAARRARYDEVLQELKSEHSSRILGHLTERVASDDWRRPAADHRLDRFARKRLDRAWKKVRRGGAKLGKLEEQELHRLRIDIKELRYSIEFMAPLYRKKQVCKFAASLEAMQDCLGLMHDDMVRREIIDHYGLDDRHQTYADRRSRQLAKMKKRYKQLKRVGRFWR